MNHKQTPCLAFELSAFDEVDSWKPKFPFISDADAVKIMEKAQKVTIFIKNNSSG